MFITIEGGEGTGKTTQAKMLVKSLVDKLVVAAAEEPAIFTV